MLLYHKYNLVMTENAKTGSNPCVVMLTALRGGGAKCLYKFSSEHRR